jgi:two-component system, response regulator YesN
MENCIPKDIENILSKIQTGLQELDNPQIDQNLKKLFKELLINHFSLDTFQWASRKLLTLMSDFRKDESITAIGNTIKDLSIDDPRFLYTLDALHGWYLHEITESISFVKRSNNFIYSRKTRKAIEYIEKNFSSNFSVEQMARELEVSAPYLSQLFKKETFYSITEYKTRFRLDKAKRLLKNTTMKIYEVAAAVGYTSSHYFSKVFIKQVALTPVQYREIRSKD